MYNRLGMQFLSPTINMWFTQRDFIKFATNLRHYCACGLKFVETDEPTPVALCDDIYLHFNHHKNSETAEIDWNRRKARIRYDNIYIIFYNRKAENLSFEEIRQIEKADCKNIAILTEEALPLDYAVQLVPNADRQWSQYFIDKDDFGIRTYEKQWDYVQWLNSERL